MQGIRGSGSGKIGYLTDLGGALLKAKPPSVILENLARVLIITRIRELETGYFDRLTVFLSPLCP